MLSSSSPSYQHALQDVILIAISVSLLPLSTTILLISYALRPILFVLRYVAYLRLAPAPKGSAARPGRRTVLVTGVGMTKGLELARAFHVADHRVIGADFPHVDRVPPCGRFSAAVSKFFVLPTPNQDHGPAHYIHKLLQIVHGEHVDLWISCSGVDSALEDARAKEVIERRSDCLCIQFDAVTTQTLHSKDEFIAHTVSLGLPVPETHSVTSRDAVHKILHQSPRTKKRYVMKNVGVDDASRGEIMTLLPRRTPSETYNYVADMQISPRSPWVLQQYIAGKKEYCTHALVINGEVRVFVACPSSDLLMHYEALPHRESALSQAMLRYTQEFVSRSCNTTKSRHGGKPGKFPLMTGHLSFDFLVDEVITERGTDSILRAIECNPRAHTAVVLFRGQERKMVDAYLSLLEDDEATLKKHRLTNGLNGHLDKSLLPPSDQQCTGSSSQEDRSTANTGVTLTDSGPVADPPSSSIVIPGPNSTSSYYWISNDIVTLLLLPLLHLFLLPFQEPYFLHPITLFFEGFPAALSAYRKNIQNFLVHLLFWADGTYVVWDPLPAWWLYHVYWPAMLLGRLWQGRKGRWSRINVSTCKVFGV